MMKNRFSRRIVPLIGLVALVFIGLWGWSNRWTIHDQWVSRSYISTPDSSEVLNNLDLTEQGNLVYRASLTEVDDKDRFRERCPVSDYEEASVLGCYSNRKIYILKVDEPRLAGVEEVTAAHELLHAKFERMGDSKKKRVGDLLRKLRNSVADTEVNELIVNYEKALGGGEELDNEMFAVYGTQLEDVGSELENIFKDYFNDRAGIVKKYLSYSSEFRRLEQAIKNYDRKLAELRTEKESLEAEIETLGSELNRDKQNIDNLENSDSQAEYQSAAAAYNIKVGRYNSKVERIRSVIAQYNQIVEVRNSEALSAKSLADKLNANVEER